MNIFFLDRDPKKAARYHCDKHVVKMPLEHCQMLSDAHRILDGIPHKVMGNKRQKTVYILQEEIKEQLIYKSFMPHHKCSKWVRKSRDHYNWTFECTKYLIEELEIRYGTVHKIKKSGLLEILSNPPQSLFWAGWEDPPHAMPTDCYMGCAVESYRNYYRMHKKDFATWKTGEPYWW